MKRILKKIKRKKSPKPPLRPLSPENPAGITAGPPGLSAEPDAQSFVGDGPDPTADQDGGGGVGIVFLDRTGEDQEHLAPDASTSGVVIGGGDYRGGPSTGECPWSLPFAPILT